MLPESYPRCNPQVVYSTDCSKGVVPVLVLTLCCFVVFSTRQFAVCLTLCYFVLVFFSPFSNAITSLGEERATLSAFHAFVRFVLVCFVGFLFVLVSGKGCSLWLWHSLDFSLTFFTNVSLGRGSFPRIFCSYYLKVTNLSRERFTFQLKYPSYFLQFTNLSRGEFHFSRWIS